MDEQRIIPPSDPEPQRAEGPVTLTGQALAVGDVIAVARHRVPVEIDQDVAPRLARRRDEVDAHVAEGRSVYGITTGLGALAQQRVAPGELEDLQVNLLRSHAAGVGQALPTEVVRAMMLLRARTLAAGYSGVRPQLVELLVACLNAGLHPVVPSRGSVGASGDLAQLAHIGLALTGEGRIDDGGGTRPAIEALSRSGLTPLRPSAKEGLALVNGTEGMLALAVLAWYDTRALLTGADVAAAMTTEGGFGSDRPFAADLQELRGQPGQADAAANLRMLLDGSEIVAAHRDSDHAVQDPYSLRCAPQVHGSARAAHAWCAEIIAAELAAVTDNPVVLADGRVESTGNFHGEPLGAAMAALGVGLASLASISERRTLWLMSPESSRELSAFLAERPGLQSGLMLAQYTQAALVAEIRQLAQPSVLDTIPTSGTQEDHVSMAWHGGLRLRELVGLAATVLGGEALCAARALDLREPLQPAPGTTAAKAALRERIAPLDGDRELAPDLSEAGRLLADGRLVTAAERALGMALR